MNLLQIESHINQGQNLLFYKKDVHDIYKQINSNFLCVFFNEPTPIKHRLMESIETVVNQTEPSLSRLTLPELIKILMVKLNSKTLIILFNNFHILTRRLVATLQELNRYQNIIFICSFDKDFKSEAYGFFTTFHLMNVDQYKLETGKDEINISYAVYFFLGLIGFFIYLKTASSAYMAAMLIGGIWFGMIIFRTFIYTGGRV
ncbi:MAG: hypothetical protein CVV28_02925 [Methanobacteriales archaeon HGW-Methanobacteriales-1]|jgi:hypothetical protein|nr:MAG: hypothetical protein CVV28_02925 [Methanobacteriales archaeon HGW-Methanobacteriales-1]